MYSVSVQIFPYFLHPRLLCFPSHNFHMATYLGDIKTSLKTVDHGSWYRCDGRTIADVIDNNILPTHYANALFLFPSGYFPDLTGYYLSNVEGTNIGYPVTFPATDLNIDKKHLPLQPYSITTSSDGNHHHDVHSYYSKKQESSNGLSADVVREPNETWNITNKTTNDGQHSHSFNLLLNPDVEQTPYRPPPPTFNINFFISLGQ